MVFLDYVECNIHYLYEQTGITADMRKGIQD